MEIQALREFQEWEPLKTGYPSFDLYLQGIPRGHFIEAFGRENSGKSTLAQNILGAIQERYPEFYCLYIDTEGNFVASYAHSCGISDDSFFVLQANENEQVLNAAYDFINDNNKNGIPSFVVIDSYAGMTSNLEIKKGISGSTMGVQARNLNKFLRMTTLPLKKEGSIVWINNQIRDNVTSQWGGITTPGGHGIAHWSKLRLALYNITSSRGEIELGGEVVGEKVDITVEKIKACTANRGFRFEMGLFYGEGFSKIYDILTIGLNLGVINQRGAWYYFDDLKFQGFGTLLEAVTQDAELLEKIYSTITGEVS